MSQWPFPAVQNIPQRDDVISPQAAWVIANPHTPEQLEAAMKAQGDLVQFHHMCGLNEPAREAYKVVRQLHAMRTPETIARLDRERGLA